MIIEPTITIGTIISIIVYLSSMGILGYKILRRLAEIELKVDLMWETYQLRRKANGEFEWRSERNPKT